MQKQKHQPSDVELRMACRNLKDTDIISKSDPFVKVELVNSDYKTIKKLGKTEQLENELNPQFATPVPVQYLFQKSQLIKFQVKDDDDGPGNADDDLGKVFIPLGEIVQAGDQGVTRRLKGKGEITVKGTVTNEPGSTTVQIRARAEDLDKKDLFGKSDGFYELYCHGNLLCRSNVVDNQTHPTWQAQSFPGSAMKGTEIEIKVYDWDDDSSNDLIGIATFHIEHYQHGMKLPLINPKKKYKKKKTNSGVFIIDEFKIVETSSFINFLESGLELNFHCAVDFTGSNGDPKSPQSLHYQNNGRTQYSDAVYSVGQVVEAYDFDKKFGSYGFGGFINKTKTTEHVFPLDQRTGNYEIPGISNIINSYFESFAYLQLSGPTNFSPVISHVMRIAEKSVGTGFYHVLMILTDGAISDMSETLSVVKRCEKLPISIDGLNYCFVFLQLH